MITRIKLVFGSSGCTLKMVCEEPKHVEAYIVLIIFNFLMVLTA